MIKKYETNKNSGVEYLGYIPDHWHIIKFKYTNEVVMGQSPSSEDYSYEENNFPFLQGNAEFGKFSPSPKIWCERATKFSQPNDILISVRAPVGAINISDKVYGIGRGLAALRGREYQAKLIYYFFSVLSEYLNSESTGSTFSAISASDIKEIFLPKISIQEQSQIIRFLDYQTAIVDEIMLRKEKQIELLKEKRQSTINQVVTKGINPDAKMKDSGVEWMGEIPQDWKILPIRYLNFKVGSGVTPKGGGEVYTEEGVVFVRSQNVHFEGLRLDDVVRIDYDTHEKMSGSKVQYKDVLLNITGASIGRCCVVNMKEKMNVNQHVCIIRPNNKISSEFLNLALQSNLGQTQIRLGITGGNRDGLNFEAIKNFLIPIPDLYVQNEIVQQVVLKLECFDVLLAKNLQQIEKLKEYRQSLISEVVTGKIDVRDWAPINKTA